MQPSKLAWILVLDIGQPASQRTQMSDVKLKNILSYRPLKTRKHLVSIVFPPLVFIFLNMLIDNLLMQFFYIQIRKMRFSVKDIVPILCFFSAFLWKHFMSLHSTKNLKKYKPPRLFKLGKWNNRHPVY